MKKIAGWNKDQEFNLGLEQDATRKYKALYAKCLGQSDCIPIAKVNRRRRRSISLFSDKSKMAEVVQCHNTIADLEAHVRWLTGRVASLSVELTEVHQSSDAALAAAHSDYALQEQEISDRYTADLAVITATVDQMQDVLLKQSTACLESCQVQVSSCHEALISTSARCASDLESIYSHATIHPSLKTICLNHINSLLRGETFQFLLSN